MTAASSGAVSARTQKAAPDGGIESLTGAGENAFAIQSTNNRKSAPKKAREQVLTKGLITG